MIFTISFQLDWLAAAASRLVDCFDEKTILGATLEAVHSVVVLLDVRHYHPAICRVTQACGNQREHKNHSHGVSQTIIKPLAGRGPCSVFR